MHPGEPSASAASTLLRLYDSELADELVLELRRIREGNRRFADELRTNEQLRAILREFSRRTAAVDVARRRYRSRHLSSV